MKQFMLFMLFATVSVFAQLEHTSERKAFVSSPKFFVDHANYKIENSDSSRVDVFIQVPYSNIQFLKTGETYSGRYSINLRLLESDETRVISEQIWDESLSAAKFAQTTSKENFNLSQRSFLLKPGEYSLICDLEDLESNKTAQVKSKLVVREFADSLDASDILIVYKVIRDKNKEKIVPNVARVLSSEVTELPFYFEVYSDTEQEIMLEYIVKNVKGNYLINQTAPVTLKPGKNTFFQTMSGVKFYLGTYSISIKIIGDGWEGTLGRTKIFDSILAGLPATVVDVDKAAQQMLYIAENEDIDEIVELNDYEEKVHLFLDFWKQRDPTPNTENNEVMNEYYRRVDYANKKFKSYFEGWKSDMGWIYITLGTPNYVLRQPNVMDTKPYEVWEYYDLNRSFTFVDETGFGHYRLINPQYGDWLRYRY